MLSLDEYPVEDLHRELERRRRLREQGLCDYCGRPPTESNCKFPTRHHDQYLMNQGLHYSGKEMPWSDNSKRETTV